jgi:addiction module HigA family antidote
MRMTEHEPVSVGEMLTEEFLGPMGVTQERLAEAMGVSRRTVNELVNNRRSVTALTALLLSRALGTSADFWLNTQRRNDLWQAMHSPKYAKQVERAKPVKRSDVENEHHA